MPRGLTLLGEESWEQALRWSVREQGAGEADVVEFVDELMLLLRLCACEGEDFMRLPLLFQNQPVLDTSQRQMCVCTRARVCVREREREGGREGETEREPGAHLTGSHSCSLFLGSSTHAHPHKHTRARAHTHTHTPC